NDNALRLTTVAQHEVPQSSSLFSHARAGVLDNEELWLSGACAPSKRQEEAQLAQAQLVNVCEIVGRNCCAEQAGGWRLPLLVAVALGRPAWAPPPTQGEIDAAAQQTGATALNNAATFDDVPVEAEIAGEVIVDAAIGVAGAAVGAGAAKGAAKGFGH